MEGVPRVPMFAPEIKYCTGPFPDNFSKQIKEYILLHFDDDPCKYDQPIGQIELMRRNIGRIKPDSDAITLLKKYFGQMKLMNHRFPMEDGDQIHVAFTWFDKGTESSSAMTAHDVNFELMNVMYDIGAVHASIASSEPRTDLNSIKNAFTHFQCAAFPFQYIRDSMNTARYSVIDFDSSTLTFYINILLAQAQECVLEKSLIDHRKNTVIAKIAIHLKDVYKHCRSHLEASVLGEIISTSKYKEWLRLCDVKSEMYHSIAMYHLGMLAEEEKKMGVRLAYMDLALQYVSAAIKFAAKDKSQSLKDTLGFLYDVISGKQTNAKKENEFVYHDRVPKLDELATVEGVVLVKPIPFDPADRAIIGQDLFSTLLSIDVLKSVSVYSEEKATLKRKVMDKVAQKDQELKEYMTSLQLEELNLNKKNSSNELPEMLLERSAAFNSQPDAFPDLLEKLQKVGNHATEADHKLNNLNNRLNAIQSVELKNDEGFKAINAEMLRIAELHTKARTNNAELQRVLAAHSESLKILAMPLTELNRRLTETIGDPELSTEWQNLKKLLDKANEMSEQRLALVQRLTKELECDDITAKCLSEKYTDNQDLYKKELKKHDETTQLIELNLLAQEKILNVLTEANANFADYRRKIINENKKRMDQILALTAAYDVFVDVSQKAKEGLNFYSTLFSLIRSLSEAVEAIETAYEEEKKMRENEDMRKFENRTSSRVSDETAMNEMAAIKSADNSNSVVSSSEGLRLKDCLEYYRTRVAQPRQPISFSKSTSPYIPQSRLQVRPQIAQPILPHAPPQQSMSTQRLQTPMNIIPMDHGMKHAITVEPSDSSCFEQQKANHLSNNLSNQLSLQNQNASSTLFPQTFSTPTSGFAVATNRPPCHNTAVLTTPGNIPFDVGTIRNHSSNTVTAIQTITSTMPPPGHSGNPNTTFGSSIYQSTLPDPVLQKTIGTVPGSTIFATNQAYQYQINAAQPNIRNLAPSPTIRHSSSNMVSSSPMIGYHTPTNLTANFTASNTASSLFAENASPHAVQTQVVHSHHEVEDLLSTPLGMSLPPPLAPETCKQESADIPGSKELESIQHTQASPKLGEAAGQLGLTQRPAAAVAPIVQTVSETCSSSPLLTMTTVTSLNYVGAAPNYNQAISPQHFTDSCSTQSLENIQHVKAIGGIQNILNPHTFEVGEPDRVRLQKRQMREQFRLEGRDAELPPLNRADPINCLDSHFWLKKQ